MEGSRALVEDRWEQHAAAVKSPRRSSTLALLSHAALFVMGFSVVFVVGWGGAATLLGQLFVDNKALLGRLGGVFVILFGLHTLGVLRVGWLNRDTRPRWRPAPGGSAPGGSAPGGGYAASALMGVAFAAGWTPCIGATLGAILTLGLSQQSSGQAMLLSSGYALGLGLPFIAISLGLDRALMLLRRLRRYTRPFQVASGLLLVVMGVLLLTNQLFYLSIWAQRNGLFLDLPGGSVAAPNYLIAIAGGLFSFLSPCVLPLVPAYMSYLGGRAFPRE